MLAKSALKSKMQWTNQEDKKRDDSLNFMIAILFSS